MSCGVVCDVCNHYLSLQSKIIQPHLITCLADYYNMATARPVKFGYGLLWTADYAINDPLLNATYVWCTISQGVTTFHISSVNFSTGELSTFAGLFKFVASDIRLKHDYNVLVGQL